MNDHCLLCGVDSLEQVPGFQAIARVTSDCKPWPAGGQLTVCRSCGTIQKLRSPAWLQEIQNIYDNYTIYHQSAGAEQAIFDLSGMAAAPRSLRLIRYLVEQLRLPEQGRLLDFGCGTGSALKNFSDVRPAWRLYGSELSERSLRHLDQIHNFSKLYTCPLTEIAERFALITLFHSLEHVLDPLATLSELRSLLEDNGHVFVQVPDCEQTPYDLVIADHLTHFTQDSLHAAAQSAGYRTELLSDSVLGKELSWIGVPHDKTTQPAPTASGTQFRLASRHIAWLEAQIELARTIASKSPRFGIFGTSISGTWLYGILRERVMFFVDEDPTRIGRMHMELPIYSPENIPADADIFVPLIPNIASSVARRLDRADRRFHTPPPFEARGDQGP